MFASLRLRRLLLFFVIFSLHIYSAASLLTFEDLEKLKYEVELVKEPITSEQIAGDGVHLSNLYGQKFFCSIPPPDAKDDSSQHDPPKVAPLNQSVVDMLKPLQKLECFLFKKGWWTYEVCPFGAIHQYRATPDDKVDGDSIRLGMYDSDFDWSKIAPEQLSSLNLRYHVQHYVHGAKCDLNGKERRTDIKYICDEDEYVSDVTELESCVYEIVFRTHRICEFEPLLPPIESEPGWVVCQPVLTEEQFVEYLDELEVQSQRYASEERTPRKSDGPTARDEEESVEREAAADEEELSEEELLKKHLRRVPWKRAADKYALPIKEAVSRQFEDIIQEAKEGLGLTQSADGVDGEERDELTAEEEDMLDQEAMVTLKATLNDLLTKLDQMEQEMGTTDELIDDIDRRLEKLKMARKGGQGRGRAQGHGDDVDNEYDVEDDELLYLQELEDAEGSYLIDDLVLTDELLLEEGDELVGDAGGAGGGDAGGGGGGGAAAAAAANQQQAGRSNEPAKNGESKEQPAPSAELLNGEGVLLKRLPNLENAIQRRLEQMGLSDSAWSKGLKIKIVATDAQSEAGDETTIDEAQTKKLEGMVMAYLNHNSELFQQESRQQKLRDSYRFVYSKKTKGEGGDDAESRRP